MPEERRSIPFLAALIAAAAVLYALHRAHEALAPFVLAAAFAYVVNPTITYFEAKGLRRSHLVVAGYLAALLLGWAAYAAVKPLVVEQAELLGAEAPVYLRQIQRLAGVQQAKIIRNLPLPRDVAQRALDSAVGSALERVQELPSQALALLPFLAHAFLVPFIAFFFLLDGAAGFEHMIQSLPSRYVEQAIHVTSEIDTALGDYLRGIILVASAIAIASFIGLLALRVDNALAIAALAGVTSFVPYLGAIVGTLAGSAMAIYQYGRLSAGLKVVLLFAGIRLADEIVLQPVIAKHSVHLHPTVFLLALLLGGQMFGFLGLVFAIPATCILKVLVKVAWSWYASESGLGARFVPDNTAIPYT